LKFEQAVKKHNAERGAKGFHQWGPISGDAVLPVCAGALVAGDLRWIGRLRAGHNELSVEPAVGREAVDRILF
jgi:hypothetical protein